MDKDNLKKQVCDAIDAAADDIKAIALAIEAEPELGFKEQKTAAKVAGYMRRLGLAPQEHLALTGVKARAKGGMPGPTVAVIGELDGIVCMDSPKADPLTGATHACGHNLQIAAMLAAATGLIKANAMRELSGDAVFFGVPAEEYVELEYRKKLVESGKTHFLSGKGQLIYEGAFDDVDMAMMMHANGNLPGKEMVIGNTSNGFIGKTIRYIGKAAHAAAAPHEGINALNAAMIGLMGINALRETFQEKDVVRVHPIITKGGDLVNNVPSDVRLETYVRASTMEAIDRTHTKVDNALKAGALAVGAEVEIETLPGQLPLACCPALNKIFVANAKLADPELKVTEGFHFTASTDMGDISHIMPAIHPYTGGNVGSLHTKNFECVNFADNVLLPAKAFAMTIIDLLWEGASDAKEILTNNPPLLTKEEYIAKLDNYFSKPA